MNATFVKPAATEPLRAIMRSFEFGSGVATPALAVRRRARRSANPKSKIQNRKF